MADRLGARVKTSGVSWGTLGMIGRRSRGKILRVSESTRPEEHIASRWRIECRMNMTFMGPGMQSTMPLKEPG